jgi:hypothetical protein
LGESDGALAQGEFGAEIAIVEGEEKLAFADCITGCDGDARDEAGDG